MKGICGEKTFDRKLNPRHEFLFAVHVVLSLATWYVCVSAPFEVISIKTEFPPLRDLETGEIKVCLHRAFLKSDL